MAARRPCRSFRRRAERNSPTVGSAASWMQVDCKKRPLAPRLAIAGVRRNTERMTPKPSALDPAVTERIGELLRARGLRRMASRIQVLAVLEPVNGHLPVAEIHRRVRACLPPGAQPPDVATI